MELGGHTDSQGGEDMNQKLSQDRAQAVLSALRERRVLVGNLTAKGYGESQPIADNDTEDGREANRRIEFVLLDEAPVETTPAATPVVDGAKDASAEPEAPVALPDEDSATEAPMGDEGPMEDAAPVADEAPGADVPAATEITPAEPPAAAATDTSPAPAETTDTPAAAPAPAAPEAATAPAVPPEVATAQDPAIEIPVAPATEAPGRPTSRPADLGVTN